MTVSLKEQIAAAFPGVVQDVPAPAPPATGKKGEHAPVNLLATNDTVIDRARVADVALWLRDTHGYALLTNLTAVDYLRDGIIEVVYHLLNLRGGAPAVFKTRVPRDAPHVPSLTPHWPGADLQEREAFDLYGVIFDGHPYLRRVFMWDEFEGFPMRKDFPKQGDKYLSENP